MIFEGSRIRSSTPDQHFYCGSSGPRWALYPPTLLSAAPNLQMLDLVEPDIWSWKYCENFPLDFSWSSLIRHLAHTIT